MHKTHAYQVKQDTLVISICTICTGACLSQRKKLASVMLHKIVPHAPLQWPPPLVKASYDDRPTCDDIHVLLIKQFVFKKWNKHVQFNATIWFDFMDRD
jgi:hypothetical protein